MTLELQKAHPELKTVTYGAPVISPSGGERHRALFDPVAMFDFGAKTELPRGINPHGYSGLAHGYHAFAKGTSQNGYTTNGSEHMYRYKNARRRTRLQSIPRFKILSFRWLH